MRLVNKLFYVTTILLLSLFVTVCEAAKPVGRVVWTKGTFTAIGENKATRSLERAGVFYERDILLTGAGSQAQVVFYDNSLMTFRENTRFRVDQYNYNAAGGKNSYVMSLAEGGFRTITGAIGDKQPENYKINTPVATIGVRGTEFIVYYKNGRLYVGRIKGKPCVYDKIKRIQVCLTPQMPYVVILGAEGPSVQTEMPDELSGSNSLTIVPAIIQPPPGGGFGGGFGGGAGGPGGEVSSFCVQ